VLQRFETSTFCAKRTSSPSCAKDEAPGSFAGHPVARGGIERRPDRCAPESRTLAPGRSDRDHAKKQDHPVDP